MHTDEYAISLSRELALCEQYVRRYGKILSAMEQRHGMTTGQLLDLFGKGASDPDGEYLEWRQAHEALQRWSVARDEYGRLLRSARGPSSG